MRKHSPHGGPGGARDTARARRRSSAGHTGVWGGLLEIQTCCIHSTRTMLHLMRRALADMVAVGQDDRPAAGGDVDMADEGTAVP